MGFARRFLLNSSFIYVKIRHRTNKNFHTIGIFERTDDKLNIAKVSFTDANGKKVKQWFHLFTGNSVTLPKKEGEWAKDIPFTSKKAYMLSVEPVYPYDIDPTMDKNYERNKKRDLGNLSESRIIIEDDPESNKNKNVKKIE